MAKYGTFKYSTQKYGTSANSAGAVAWIVQIGLSSDGGWNGTNEAGRLVDLTIRRGRRHYLQPGRTGGSGGFEPQEIGEATLLFDDKERRYDPYNTASPIYPIKPGLPVMIAVKDNSSNIVYQLFLGWLLDIQPESDENMVRMECADGWDWLNRQKAVLPYGFINIQISQAMQETLLAIDYPATPAWDIPEDTQPVRVFSLGGLNAASVMQNLADACLGHFFFTRRGVPTFYPRNETGMTTHSIDQAVLNREIVRGQPWDIIANDITVVAHRIIKKLRSDVWFLPDPLYVADGATVNLIATYDVAVDVTLRSYKAFTNSNGTGTELTSGFEVTAACFEAYTDFSIVNNSGSNGYITELILRGRTLADRPVEYSAEDATSQANYNPLYLTLDTPYLQSRNYADAFADIILAHTKDPHKTPQIKINQRPSVQYPLELQDKVTLTSAKLDISETFSILGLEHRWLNDTGQDVETTVFLAPVIWNNDSITPEDIDVEQPIPEEPPEEPPEEEPPSGGGGTGEPPPDPTAAVAVASTISSVYVSNDFGATSPAWVSKGWSTSGIVDADVSPRNRDIYYVITADNIYTCEDLSVMASSTFTSRYAATSIGTSGKLLRVICSPTDARTAWALGYCEHTGDATKADAYCLKTTDGGSTWSKNLIRENAASMAAYSVTQATGGWTDPGGNNNVHTRVGDSGSTYNPWAMAWWYNGVPSSDHSAGLTTAATTIHDFNQTTIDVNVLYGAANDLLAAPDQTTAEGWMLDYFGYAPTPGAGTCNMTKDAARVNVGWTSAWGASDPVFTCQSWVFWNSPSVDAPSAFACAPNGSWLYVGFEDEIWKSEDGGATWFALEEEKGAYDIAVDTQASGLIYYWGNDGIMYYDMAGTRGALGLTETPALRQNLRTAKSINTGELWTISGTILYERNLGSWSSLVAATGGAVSLRAYAGSYPRLIYATGSDIIYSEDGGTTRSNKKGDWSAYANPRTIHLLE